MSFCNILETNDAKFTSLMLFDREDGDSIQLAPYSPGVSGIDAPLLMYCHVTSYHADKRIVSKASYLQRDVFMPDRFSTSITRVCRWLSGVAEYTDADIDTLHSAESWQRVLYNIGEIRPMNADRCSGDIHSVASSFYRKRGGKTSWLDFLSFLVAEHAESDYPALLVAAMVRNYNRSRVVYYELLMLVGAIDRRREHVNPSMAVLAGLCDCVLFEAHVRWMRNNAFPFTGMFLHGNHRVHLAILSELRFYTRK